METVNRRGCFAASLYLPATYRRPINIYWLQRLQYDIEFPTTGRTMKMPHVYTRVLGVGRVRPTLLHCSTHMYCIVLYCIQIFIQRPSTAIGKQRRFWFD